MPDMEGYILSISIEFKSNVSQTLRELVTTTDHQALPLECLIIPRNDAICHVVGRRSIW